MLEKHHTRSLLCHSLKCTNRHGNGCNGRTYFSTSLWLFEKQSTNYGNLLIYLENVVHSPPFALSFVAKRRQISKRMHFLTCRGVKPSKNNVYDALRPYGQRIPQLAFYVNLHRAVIGPSATLTGRWRPDIDLHRMLTGTFNSFFFRKSKIRQNISPQIGPLIQTAKNCCRQIQVFYSKSRVSPICLGGSVGCAVRLETRRSQVQPPPRSATFFRGDWSWNIFYGHSLPSADSRRAVVSFWRKNVHNTG